MRKPRHGARYNPSKAGLAVIAAVLIVPGGAAFAITASGAGSPNVSSQKPFPETGGVNQPGKCPNSGLPQNKCPEGPGADKQQPVTHGDCKNPGTKSDTLDTTGNHQGFDCVPAAVQPTCPASGPCPPKPCVTNCKPKPPCVRYCGERPVPGKPDTPTAGTTPAGATSGSSVASPTAGATPSSGGVLGAHDSGSNAKPFAGSSVPTAAAATPVESTNAGLTG
ncbi:MAG: hypothetical protein QOH13_1333 [Thermoleophilaceae bacterium]|nr:hypothetical protein [Thermoleophilaceae bacterium]